MDDSDSDYEIEETVVLVELNGIIDANFLFQEQNPCKVLGIDTENPIMQIGHYIFTGEYEDTPGTIACYEPVDSPANDALENPELSFKFTCKTDKKLTMKRVFIQDKTKDHVETSQNVSCSVEVSNRKTEHLLENTSKPINQPNDSLPETALCLPIKEKNIINLSVQPAGNDNLENGSSSISLTSSDSIKLSCEKRTENTLNEEKDSLPVATRREKYKASNLKDSNRSNREPSPKLTKKKKPLGRKAKKRKHASPQREETKNTDLLPPDININKQIKTETGSVPFDTGLQTFEDTERLISSSKSELTLTSNLVDNSVVGAQVVSSPEPMKLETTRPTGQSSLESSLPNTVEVEVLREEPSKEQAINTNNVNSNVEPESLAINEIDEEEGIVLDLEPEKIISEMVSIVDEVISAEGPIVNLVTAQEIKVISSCVETPETSQCTNEESSSSNINLREVVSCEQKEESSPDTASANENFDIEASSISLIRNENEDSIVLNSDPINQLVESSTDKKLLSLSSPRIDEARNNDNCSSTGDIVKHVHTPTPFSSDVCQTSSDSKGTSVIVTETVDNNGASSSSSNLDKSIQGKSEVEEKLPSNLAEINKLSMPCEVTQSFKDDAVSEVEEDAKESNECEVYNSADLVNPPSDVSRAVEDATLQEVNEPNQTLLPLPTISHKRKLSSCEVTQSSNSERELFDNRYTMDECEVFIQNNSTGNEGTGSSEVVPFVSVNEISNEIEYSRTPLPSEGSTSEISQSHKSVLQESVSGEERNVEDILERDGGVCSQSSDQSNKQSIEISAELKDLCVSSCDVSQEIAINDEESLVSEEDTSNTSCEISQSDKVEGIGTHSIDIETPERDIQMFANECDEARCISEEDIVNPLETGYSETTTNTDINKQAVCEVTQSFCSETKTSVFDSNNLDDDQAGSSECDIGEENTSFIELIDEDSEAGALNIENSVICKVSQSSESKGHNAEYEASEACGSSDIRITSDESLSEKEIDRQVYKDIKVDSNECDTNEDSAYLEVSSDEPRNNFQLSELSRAIQSDVEDEEEDQSCAVSQSVKSKENTIPTKILLKVDSDMQEVDPNCEVSQSFKSKELVGIYDESQPCGSSEVVFDYDAKNSEENRKVLTQVKNRIEVVECDTYDESSASIEILDSESKDGSVSNDEVINFSSPKQIESEDQDSQSVCEISHSLGTYKSSGSSAEKDPCESTSSSFKSIAVEEKGSLENCESFDGSFPVTVSDNCASSYTYQIQTSTDSEVAKEDNPNPACAVSQSFVSRERSGSTLTYSEVETGDQEEDPLCQVSQSFKPREENLLEESEACGSSDVRSEGSTRVSDQPGTGFLGLETGDRLGPNECEVYDDSSVSIEILCDDSKDKCLLSGDNPMVPLAEQSKLSTCEVSQSFKIEERSMKFEETEFCGSSTMGSGYPKNLEDNETSSVMMTQNDVSTNECDTYEDSSNSIEILDDESKDNCASSDDVSQQSVQTGSEVEVEGQEKEGTCVVSQSFRTERSIVSFEEMEPCGSSDYKVKFPENKEKSKLDSKLSMEDKVDSNECDTYDDSSCSIEVLTKKSNNCASDNIIPLSVSGSKCEEGEKNVCCEVSQSFISKGKTSFEDVDPCGSSDVRKEENFESNETESMEPCRVTQSLKLEREELYNEDDNECDQAELNFSLDKYQTQHSDEFTKDICESSDDIIVIASEESLEEQSVNCEVSQSYRQEGALNLSAEQSSDVDVESSNECDMYPPPPALPVPDLIIQKGLEQKSICESSDDVIRSLETQISSIQTGNETCQSSKYDENDLVIDARNTMVSICDTPTNEMDSNRDTSHICESTEGVRILETVNQEAGLGVCTSSNKVFKEPHNNSDHLCENYDPAPEALVENDQISQSENKTVNLSCELGPNFSSTISPQNDQVNTTSQSHIISSSGADVTYAASSVSNSNFPSNSEVSQSSSSCIPCVWDGNSFLSTQMSALESVVVSSEVLINTSSALTTINTSNLLQSGDAEIVNIVSSNEVHQSNVETLADRFVESSISSSSISHIEPHGSSVLQTQSSDETEANSVLDSTSIVANAPSAFERGSVISSASKYNFTSQQSSSNLRFIGDSEINTFPTKPASELGSSSDVRPSLLEVIVSSASDFRNSLLYDSNSFGRESNQTTLDAESSNNVALSKELLEPTIGEVDQSSKRSILNVELSVENSGQETTVVGKALSGNIMNMSAADSSRSQHHISQSSDIGHSSTRNIETIVTDSIPGIVQPSSTQSISTKTHSNADPCYSASNSMEENATVLMTQIHEVPEGPESSSTQIHVTSDQEVLSHNIHPMDPSNVSLISTDTEISSTPFHLQHSNIEVLAMDENEQCSVIEGSFIIVSESGEILHRSEDSIQQGSVANEFVFLDSSLAAGQTLILETSNEAETMNSIALSSSQSQLQIGAPVTTSEMGSCELVIEEGISPTNEVEIVEEVYECTDNSVPKLLEVQQTGHEHPCSADDNPSSSALDLSSHEPSATEYSFPQTGFACVSQGDSTLPVYENESSGESLLPVPHLPATSGTELSMYSHIGEFEDSVQSSSLDATHISINEQIKAISSPSFSNSDTNDEQTPLTIPPFSLPSESHSLPSIQCTMPIVSNISSTLLTERFQSECSDITVDSETVQRPSYSVCHPSPLEVASSESFQPSSPSVTVDSVSPQQYILLNQTEETQNICSVNDNSIDQSQAVPEKTASADE